MGEGISDKGTPARGPTVYDIADYLGVSAATVSRTLNGSKLVSTSMQERVLAAADALGYSRRTIRRQRSRSIFNIALFLPVTDARYAGLFYDVRELVAGVEDGLEAVRANIVVDLVGRTQLLEQKKLGDIHGCLFAFCRPDSATASSIAEQEIPAVLINRSDSQWTCVRPDTESGMRQLVSAAVSAGHTNICYLAFSGAREVSEQRLSAFDAACRSAGLSCASDAIRWIDDIGEIDVQLVQELSRAGFSACFCFNDLLAIRFLDSARQAGLRVPEDIAVAGFDDSPILDLMTQRIDTVSLSTADLGRRAGEWIAKAIIERSTDRTHELVAVEYVPGMTLGGPV